MTMKSFFQLVKNLDQEQALRIFHSCNQVKTASTCSQNSVLLKLTEIKKKTLPRVRKLQDNLR